MLAVNIPANNIQAGKVDTVFLDKGQARAAGEFDRAAIVLETHHRFFADKIFDRENRDLRARIARVVFGSLRLPPLHPPLNLRSNLRPPVKYVRNSSGPLSLLAFAILVSSLLVLILIRSCRD